MSDISGYGTTITVVASQTFPTGFTITEAADDADYIDFPAIEVADAAMGVNGDLITWSKANPLKATINVIPDSRGDNNLAILLEANRVGKGKLSVQDLITVTVVYPSGATETLTKGKITSGMPSDSVSSAGRLKTKPYMFVFENKTATSAVVS